ncbi:MAG: DUF1501 domain-containing protein [Planctomycetaceae bacterium]
MATHRTCDGMRRRDMLRIGALGGSALSLANHLRWAAAGNAVAGPAQAAIFVNLGGGPSHLDTFDMKPDAAAEVRGEFRPVATSVPGMEICEHLPKLAACADRYAILRGVSHTLAAHELGSSYVHTGNRPIASLQFPSHAAVVSKELGGADDLPSSVAIPTSRHGAGYLGVRYAAFGTGSAPKAGKPFGVRGVSLDGSLTIAQVDRRHALLEDLDGMFRDVEDDSQLVEGLDSFSRQAHTIITSPRARRAFDVSREEPAFAAPFGSHDFGQSCLLATRLVESGVRFVTVQLGGWDTHADNWRKLKSTLLPTLDEGLAALFVGLEQKGLLASTCVLVTGEFGRTPRINQRAGRDHYPRAMFMLMAGGGVRGGQVIGASDAKAAGPAGDPIRPDDVAATLYRCLGIDPRKEYHTATGRPVMIVRDGTPITGLLG